MSDDHQIYEAGKALANVKKSHHLAGMHLNGMKTTCSRVTIVNTKPWQCETKEG